MVVRRKPTPNRWIVVAVLACASLLLIVAPVHAAEGNYASAIPEEIQACARTLAWTSGYWDMTHPEEQWGVRENAPREMCDVCGSPMCVVCMEYDLGRYDTRPGTTVALWQCKTKVETYLWTATRQETEILAAIYWTAYWDGRHNRNNPKQPTEPAEPILENPESVPGKPGPNGEVEFETPFISGITSFRVARVTDCSTWGELSPADVEAQFVFCEGAKPPFGLGDLEMVVLSADAYASEVITEFAQITMLDLFFLQVVYIVPVQQAICLVQLSEGQCKFCTVKLEILSDNGSVVKARLLHCREDGKWEQWFKGDLLRSKGAPPKECKTCTYWLQYEQVETVDQNNKPMSYGKYTLYHCNPDNVWTQVFVLAVEKVKEKPQGKCMPEGREIIVVTEKTVGKKTYVYHELLRCSSAGQWVRIGGWTEEKAAK